MVCILTLSACNQKENEDILYLGINAEIVEIDTDNQIVYVVDFGEKKSLEKGVVLTVNN